MENSGKKVKDKITGFEGIVVAKCIYLTGCNQYGVGDGVAVSDVKDENDGGPNRDCPCS